MDYFLNRHSDVPIGRQIRGMIQYAISFGDLTVGAALPSVRGLARQLGVAPMTVSQVYSSLREDGLIETRAGAGTFVADSVRAKIAVREDIAQLHHEIDELISKAMEFGFSLEDFRFLFDARLDHIAAIGKPAVVAVVGLFDEATASYARAIEKQLGAGVAILPVTVRELEADNVLRARTATADFIVTFLALQEQLNKLLTNIEVVPIHFIPSEPTRLALASMDPLARVVIVSHFPSFMPILNFGVKRFAAHCQDIISTAEDDPGLEALLANCDVLIFSTGAQSCVKLVPETTQVIEYRHIPDPGDINRLIKPALDKNAVASSQGEKQSA